MTAIATKLLSAAGSVNEDDSEAFAGRATQLLYAGLTGTDAYTMDMETQSQLMAVIRAARRYR